MKNGDIWTGEASLVRGYAWHVYPDPASAGALAGDSPFGSGGADDAGETGGADDADGPVRPPLEPPPGIAALWTVRGKLPTLVNQVEDRAYLILSESDKPPGVASGWFVEPARLSGTFELDQRGGRTVRLVRVVRTAETPWGPLQECEFQIDRG
jgi:hypothetical protein